MVTVIAWGLLTALVLALILPGTREDAWEMITAAPLVVQVGFLVLVLPIALWIMRAMLYARQRAQAVRMSPTQFPEGFRIVAESAAQFGLRRVPDAYVVSGNGVINAFAFGHGFRRTVIVHSDLFEVGGAARDPQALRFVVAHEVGHIAAGHVSYFRLLLTNLAHQIPFLGVALSRAQEYTADNFGYAHCPQGATGAMAVLSAGKYLNSEVNIHELADRAATEKGLWVHLVHWQSTHPVLTWRTHALRDRSRPGAMLLRPGLLTRPAHLFDGPLPGGHTRSSRYPSPADALAMLAQADARRLPGTNDQFGRFPGRHDAHRPPLRVMQTMQPLLSIPTGLTLSPPQWRGSGQPGNAGPASRTGPIPGAGSAGGADAVSGTGAGSADA